MGEGWILGVAYSSRINNPLTVFYFCFGILTFSSCTHIPRIIVLNDPLTAEEHLSLGLSYELRWEYDLAIQEYNKALKKGKKDYRPMFYLGNVYYKEKDYIMAEKYYNNALRIDPENGDVHNNLTWVYFDTERFEDARDEIEKALRVKRNPYYLDTLANVYSRMGRYEDAIGVLQEALSVTAVSDSSLLYNEYKLLGELYEKMGKHEVAVDAWKRAEELIPLNPPLIKGK